MIGRLPQTLIQTLTLTLTQTQILTLTLTLTKTLSLSLTLTLTLGSCLVHVDENCFFADCPLPPDARVAHIVRNTFDMVVSGYLYPQAG